ncbi:MAG: gluconate 2-dehydrogenase subunit 3 family protein [Deltaproteobacteria bacterium]|nr:gluconate 2-dehydrogenase subunit 3 family protein [Deltaproteobacteria bacterium]
MIDDPRTELAGLFAAPLERRRFLRSSAAGVALLGFGALLPAGCRGYPKPAGRLTFFTAKEYAVVNQAAARLLGAGSGVGPGEDQIDVAARVDPWVATWDAEAQKQLRVMLRVFEHGTYLFDLQRKRFTLLSDEDKDRYLEGWMRSTLGARRVAFRSLKALAAAGFYPQPESWAALAYEGPWLGRVAAASPPEPEAAVPLAAVPRQR